MTTELNHSFLSFLFTGPKQQTAQYVLEQPPKKKTRLEMKSLHQQLILLLCMIKLSPKHQTCYDTR